MPQSQYLKTFFTGRRGAAISQAEPTALAPAYSLPELGRPCTRGRRPLGGAPLDLGVTLDRRPPPGPSYGVRHSRSVLLVILLVLLLGLVPVAYASPPDPTWIGGYWDDDDFDNAVISIVSACAISIPPVPHPPPQWARLAGIALRGTAFIL